MRFLLCPASHNWPCAHLCKPNSMLGFAGRGQVDRLQTLVRAEITRDVLPAKEAIPLSCFGGDHCVAMPFQ